MCVNFQTGKFLNLKFCKAFFRISVGYGTKTERVANEERGAKKNENEEIVANDNDKNTFFDVHFLKFGLLWLNGRRAKERKFHRF